MFERVCLLLALACFHHAALASTCDNLDVLAWLIGDWHSESDGFKTTESWRRVSQATFEGVGQTQSIESGKTVSSENNRLVEMSGDVFYIAKVKSNEYPVPFKLTACNDQLAVFENTEHDFPQKLEYRRKGEESILVSVSGAKGKGFEIRYRH